MGCGVSSMSFNLSESETASAFSLNPLAERGTACLLFFCYFWAERSTVIV